MADEPTAFDYGKLSPRDKEILRTFQETNEFETRPPDDDRPVVPLAPQPVDPTLELEDEMISVFATEVEEDLAILRSGLEEAERDEDVHSPGFLTLQHIAHKIRGSASMIGCEGMSTIAHRIELVVRQILLGKTDAHTGLYGLAQAAGALEMTLASVVAEKQEDLQPLLSLEQDFVTLGISLEEAGEDIRFSMGALETRAGASKGGKPGAPTIHDTDVSFTQGGGDFDQIIGHSERLIEQQTALEDARKQVSIAFQELHTAQARLRRIEAFFSSLFLSATMAGSVAEGEGAMPASSLVARILREAEQRTGRAYRFETGIPALLLEDAARWDELEMDRFSETNLLVYALNEAIGDITTATIQLQRALAYQDTLMGQHIATTQRLHAGITRHFPQATRMVRGLLVRAWEQQVIIPFTQVLRIDYQGSTNYWVPGRPQGSPLPYSQEGYKHPLVGGTDYQRQEDYQHFYTLNALLGFPSTAAPDSWAATTAAQVQPVLRLVLDGDTPAAQTGVQVEEVIGQVELLVRQPPAPLLRPGVNGMAIDSAGNVLLVLDLAELIWREQSRQGQQRMVSEQRQAYEVAQHAIRARPKILIVDDSVTIRRTLRQTLSQKDYAIVEAADGREALEKIEEESPDLLLLDLEMPRMNGYEVMKVLRTRALLPNLKIALLTSRNSHKHKKRAHELGAHKYLSKPCAENTLLETVAELLA